MRENLLPCSIIFIVVSSLVLSVITNSPYFGYVLGILIFVPILFNIYFKIKYYQQTSKRQSLNTFTKSASESTSTSLNPPNNISEIIKDPLCKNYLSLRLLPIAKEKYKGNPTVKTFLGHNTKVLGEIKYDFKYKVINCSTCCLYDEELGWVEIVNE